MGKGQELRWLYYVLLRHECDNVQPLMLSRLAELGAMALVEIHEHPLNLVLGMMRLRGH